MTISARIKSGHLLSTLPQPINTAKEQRDIALIERARSGDLQAFKTLVRRYQDRAFVVADRILGNSEDAEDVTQEVFVKVFENLAKFNTGSRFFTWLYRIVVNACYDVLRKRGRYQTFPLEELPDELLPCESSEGDTDALERIYQLMKYLSTPQKTALILREREGLSCREIAKVLRCAEGTVRSHIFHARQSMQALIEKHYPEYLEGNKHEMC